MGGFQSALTDVWNPSEVFRELLGCVPGPLRSDLEYVTNVTEFLGSDLESFIRAIGCG